MKKFMVIAKVEIEADRHEEVLDAANVFGEDAELVFIGKNRTVVSVIVEADSKSDASLQADRLMDEYGVDGEVLFVGKFAERKAMAFA